MMKLVAFRVQNFRSVVDSDWITTDDVAALIGTNESGKTNLLIPLWKLNPAKEGEINLLADLPRKSFHELRDLDDKPVFISARFALDTEFAADVAAITNSLIEDVREVIVHRYFDGNYTIEFPEASPVRHVVATKVRSLLTDAKEEITALRATPTEVPLKEAMLGALTTAVEAIAGDHLGQEALEEIKGDLKHVDTSKATKNSVIAPRFEQVLDTFDEWVKEASAPAPADVDGVFDLVMERLPKFVYYSNYGNLDSEIYLPHVIQNLKRKDLGTKEEAKARTLKVLFEFVKLSPQEIYDLGKDPVPAQGQALTETQIRATAEKKKERDVLLQSASGALTERFREWWKQGDYRFRFHADGDHFRIWVSDSLRPDEVELEARSTGLQWFLSFYLIFLVESQDSHAGTILLLDEAGLSLHPLAQKDLSLFFEGLAKTNQIVYTTHSPFLVDPDHLDRVKAVYVDENGATKVSSDLRAAEKQPAATKSIYAVHAALGLSVSEALLQGCQPVIVEGPSDQLYLSAIKTHLISQGLIQPMREVVFLPSGGVRGITAVVPVITAKDEDLPFVVLDSDRPGVAMAKKLTSGLYQGSSDRIIQVGEAIGIENAEIEDLFPTQFIAQTIDRYLPRPADQEDDFIDFVQIGKPIIPQVEVYAAERKIDLTPGWKVEVARRVKAQLLKRKVSFAGDERTIEVWKQLFDRFLQPH